VIQDRGVEFILGREVAKYHRFGNARGLSNFFRGGAPKSFAGKQPNCYSQNLQFPVFGTHSGGDSRGF
jgi:hypothetical protein